MKKKQLEMQLEKIKGFKTPSPRLEQYVTPAPVAAELLHMAYMRGDIEGRVVYDLGCGTGTLAIGAKLLEASEVVGFDIDAEAVEVAEQNSRLFGTDVRFIQSDINGVQGNADTAVMNPPFGAQNPGADRPFISKALQIAPVVYSLHNAGSEDFIKRFIEPNITKERCPISFPIKWTFDFHTQEVREVDVDLYMMKRRERGERER